MKRREDAKKVKRKVEEAGKPRAGKMGKLTIVSSEMQQFKKRKGVVVGGLFVDNVPEGEKLKLISREYVPSRGSFLIYNDTLSIEAIGRHRISDVSAIVPDMGKYVREMAQHGYLRMGLNKLRSVGAVQLVSLGIKNIHNLPRILSQDMRVIVPLMVSLDYAEIKKVRPARLFLHYHLTDLALANNNKELIVAYLRLKSAYPGCELGVMTHNLSLCEQKLCEWGLGMVSVLAQFSSRGAGMRASQKLCESVVRNGRRSYYAYSYIPASKKGSELSYLKKIGVRQAYFSYI